MHHVEGKWDDVALETFQDLRERLAHIRWWLIEPALQFGWGSSLTDWLFGKRDVVLQRPGVDLAEGFLQFVDRRVGEWLGEIHHSGPRAINHRDTEAQRRKNTEI
jgi:hypothetical protein